MTTPTPHPSGPDEPIAHVANDYNASGLSCHITEYLPAGMALYARPSTMPALTDAMRAVLRNEHDVYQSEDALYAALVAAADLKAQGSATSVPLGSMTSPHTSPGGPGQPVPMPASETVQEKAQPKRRPYNASGSLSEYGVFPECDAAQASGQLLASIPEGQIFAVLNPGATIDAVWQRLDRVRGKASGQDDSCLRERITELLDTNRRQQVQIKTLEARIHRQAQDAVAELVHAMFRSGNEIPIERITITRQQYDAARAAGGEQ